jgi:WD40 repeat protein
VPGVFISYAREDIEFVTRLHAALLAVGRAPAWDQDHSVIPFGADFRAEVAAAITASDKMIFVLSPASLASTECRRELERAEDARKQIIPLLRVPLPEDAEVPACVASPNWIFFTDDSQTGFDRGLGQLIEALDTDLDWAHAHARLQVRAEEWSRARSDRSRLLRGADLRAAETWLAEGGDHPKAPPTPLQRDFLAASRRAVSRLARLVRAALAAGMAVALTLAVFAYIQRATAVTERATAVTEKNQAVFNQTSAEAAQMTETNTSLSANLNAAAYDMRRTSAIESRLIQAENTPLATPLETGTSPVNAVAFSPSGQLLATANSAGVVQLWQLRDLEPRLIHALRAVGASVNAVAFSPSGEMLAEGLSISSAAGQSGAVLVWSIADPSKPQLVAKFTTAAAGVYSLEFSPDGTYLATGNYNGTGYVYSLARRPDERPVAQLDVAPAGDGVSIAFSVDGKTLAMGSQNGALRLWNFSNPSMPRSLGQLQAPNSPAGGINGLAFSSDGAILATGSMVGGIVRLWNVSSHQQASLQSQPQGSGAAGVSAVAFHGSHTLMTGSVTGAIQLWNVANPTLPEPIGLPFAFGTGAVTSLAIDPAALLAVSADTTGTVALWHLPATILVSSYLVSSVAYSPHGQLLASGSLDHTVSLWDLGQPGPKLLARQALSQAVQSVAFSPDGDLLAAAGEPGMARLYDIAGTSLRAAGPPFRADSSDVLSVAFSSDHVLATGGQDGVVDLWGLSDPAQPALIAALKQPGGHAVHSIAFSPTGSLLAVGTDDGAITVYDVGDPERPVQLARTAVPGYAEVLSVAFSPGGRVLASASVDGTVALWSVAASHRLRMISDLSGPGGSVAQSVAIAGGQLAVGDYDGIVQLWNIASPATPALTGQLTLSPADSVMAVAFNPTGRMLATGSFDALRMWDLSVPSAWTWICSATPDTLSAQVWQSYVPERTYQPPCRSDQSQTPRYAADAASELQR